MPQNQLTTDSSGQKIYVSGATPTDVSNTISAASLTPSTPIDVGTSPSPTNPGTGGTSSTIKTNADVLTQAQLDAQNALLGRTQFNDSATNALADLNKLSSQNATTDTNASLYEKTYGIAPGTAQADRTQALSDFNTSNKAYQDAKDRYNALNAQVQGLDYQANTVIPNQAQQDATGRGITAGGLAPITAAQQRQILLQKAPLQYSALLAQADQANALGKVNLAKGILDQANAHIDELYKAQTTDLANAQNRQNSLIDKAWSYMTTAEQNKATELKAQTASNTNQASAYINDVQAAIKEATTNGNSELAGQIAKLMTVQLDPTSKTFAADYQKANTELAALSAKVGSGVSSGKGGYAPSVTTIQTPTGSTAVTQYALKAGEDPYIIAQQNGTDMATLQKLNPNITGTQWNNLPVGAVINLPNSSDAWLNGKSAAQVQTYNALPSADKASIKQLVNGDVLLSDLVKSRGAQGTQAIQKLINEATAIDPSFSVNTNKQRYQYKTQFNNPNGKEQSQVYSINTALGHLAEFNSAAAKLGNTIALPYNKLVNYLKVNAGNPDVSNLNTVITALSGELASVYKNGTAPTDQETEQWRNTILSSFSQQQAAGVAATTANLISNKMLSLNNAYKNIMGSYPDAPIINQDVIQQLNDSGVNISAITDRLKAQGYNVPTTLSPTGVHNTLNQYGLGSADSILGQYGL